MNIPAYLYIFRKLRLQILYIEGQAQLLPLYYKRLNNMKHNIVIDENLYHTHILIDIFINSHVGIVYTFLYFTSSILRVVT